jgi:hypothetical protein
MAQLFVVLCLLSNNQCSERAVPGATAASIEVCMKTSEEKISAWYQSDPENAKYKVMGKNCKKV